MGALHRHQLVRLTAKGWRGVLERPWDAVARSCIEHWAAQDLPLVVTRQDDAVAADRLSLGLAAPAKWDRRRIAVSIARSEVECFAEFPAIGSLASVPPCSAWRRLCHALGATTRVYGSHGWQAITGLPYVHAQSDIDLWTAVDDHTQADAIAAVLHRYDGPRLDGELLFHDGRAFAWREWQAWRQGRSRSILVKTLSGAALVESQAALTP